MCSCKSSNNAYDDLDTYTDDTVEEETSDDEIGSQEPACNPFLEYLGKSGCESNQNCIFLDSTTTKCVSRGTVPIGGQCGGADKVCEIGVCLNLGGVGFRCYRYCKGKTWCEKNQDCIPINNVPPPGGVCTLPPSVYEDIRCDLLKQDCDTDQACYVSPLAPFPVCLSAGMAQQGEPCSTNTDCAKGFACNGNACSRLCGLGAGDPGCPEPYECKQYYQADAYLCVK